MKREAINHVKIRLLARDLGASINEARGLMVTLWVAAAINFPRGDVGRLPDDELAVAVDWQGDPAVLITALLRRRLLDEIPVDQGRLYIHDWHEHADDTVHYKLARAGLTFANGAESRRKKTVDDKGRTVTKADSTVGDGRRRSATVGDGLSSPSPSPSPSPSEKDTDLPLASLAAPPGGHGDGDEAQPVSVPPPEPVDKPPPKRKPTKRLPADVTLTEQRRRFALEAGLTDAIARLEWAKLADHEFRVAHTDWDAVWRNWVRNVAGRAGNRPRSSSEVNQANIHSFLAKKAATG